MLQLFCTTPLLPLLQWNCSNIESRECEFCFYLSIECVFYIVSPMTHRLLFILENVGAGSWGVQESEELPIIYSLPPGAKSCKLLVIKDLQALNTP